MKNASILTSLIALMLTASAAHAQSPSTASGSPTIAQASPKNNVTAPGSAAGKTDAKKPDEGLDKKLEERKRFMAEQAKKSKVAITPRAKGDTAHQQKSKRAEKYAKQKAKRNGK